MSACHDLLLHSFALTHPPFFRWYAACTPLQEPVQSNTLGVLKTLGAELIAPRSSCHGQASRRCLSNCRLRRAFLKSLYRKVTHQMCASADSKVGYKALTAMLPVLAQSHVTLSTVPV